MSYKIDQIENSQNVLDIQERIALRIILSVKEKINQDIVGSLPV